ncbi:hypothetical protein HYZ99_03480 [Candidatus Peregrinibacteria bacterium]|nr:hypothetical protein [Candidatus Peregrinibacteria bacterium]
MKKSIFLAPLFLLAACGPTINEGAAITLEQLLENPLYAEQYYDLLLERMVELEIQKDPILEEGSKKSLVEDVRRDALAKAREATAKQREGFMGVFVPAKEQAHGEALYVDDTLYLGPSFDSPPGPDLRVYLSTLVDPRDGEFPDEQSLDLGRLESPFGTQRFSVKPTDSPELYRTAVLYDADLDRMYSFAQLSQ